MLVLGIETSCDETGVAVYDSGRGLLANALHSQVALHDEYGGVVPELASRDHVRRLLPLVRSVLEQAGVALEGLDAVAYTQGPGLAGALLVGASTACALARGLGIPAVPVHHLEAHLLSPLLAREAPGFPFLALLVAGGVGANLRLRQRLDAIAAKAGFRVFYPEIEFCTDNGAMIALAAALRLGASLPAAPGYAFTVRPRWDLAGAGTEHG